ncbi:MAG: hypothetical protein EA361_11760 [Bacteroidetes bacterium]|nr:MAG: hypothetical protein EA361_11760 [Bacteroidota bacterium]
MNTETFDSDTLELPETSSSSSLTDTIPSRLRNERRSRGDTTTVLPPDTPPLQPVVTTEDATTVEPEDQQEDYPQIKVHSPLKATMLSATLPGLGQAYNGKYWKIPFLYAFIGGTVYAVDFNNKQYQHFRRNWVARIDGNPNTQDEYPNVATDRLQREMNRWRRNVEVSYIVGAAIYILNILDATVDAHLLDFDVGEDLTLNVMPVVMPQNSTFGNRMNPVSPGIRLSFRF